GSGAALLSPALLPDRLQRAPRSQVVVPGGRLPCLPRRAVTSRRRGTPRLAPPSGSSPETPLDERGWESYSIASICSQDKNAFCRQYATAEKTRLAMRCQPRRDFHELISPLRRQPAFTGERAKLLAGGRGFDAASCPNCRNRRRPAHAGGLASALMP